MVRNYFKTALRNLGRNKTFALINVIGLVLGLAVFIIIMLWVQYEMNYNGFHKDKDRIAAIMSNQKFENGEVQTFPAVPALLAPAIQKDLPAVEYAANASWGDERQFTVGDKNFVENGLYVSPEFLKIFNFPLLNENTKDVLTQPNTILITEKLAQKYFGNENPVGKIITIEQNKAYRVEGVLRDIPEHATLRFDYLMPVNDYLNGSEGGNANWEISNMRAYVKLKPGVDKDQFEKSFTNILAKYTNKQPQTTNFLWALEDWYLRYDFKDGKYAGGGRIAYVKLFIAIAFFILLLACINFMNLSTARATQRAKEVGVRKVIGAGRSSLVKQFMSESVLLSLLSGIIAIAVVLLTLPVFNSFFGKNISIDFTNLGNLTVFLSIILITGLLAGSYPAFVLSSFKPIKVLKNVFVSPYQGSVFIRKGLVVAQFVVSVALIVGTIIISQQVNYIQNRDLGFNKEHLIWFPNHVPAEKNETFMRELNKVPGVISTSQASITFTMSNSRGTQVSWPGKKEGQDVFFSFVASSSDLVKTMGLTITEGNTFTGNYSADTSKVLVNEEAVKRMGLKNPVGQTLDLYYGKATIAGVVKDFHFESLHNPIAPAIIMCRPDWTWLMYVRTDGKNMQQTLARVEEVYKTMAPGFVFEYNFQDKEYERLYKSESQIGILVNWFTFFAVLISCLGLFGLTAYTVERKAKEIGIRKVLGASVMDIVTMLSREFVVLVLLSVLIAAIPAYYFMNSWLQNYAYRIELHWWVFIFAGVFALLIALVTVSLQAIKAAVTNPIKSLRTE
jgi:putative ABC transport system permease protein